MLVSHRHAFIYTKTIKTAGTSVEAYFERFCLADPEQPISEVRDQYVSEAGIVGARSMAAQSGKYEWWNHMPAALIRQKLGGEMFGRYFKFCCIRNPFDRVLSAYFWYDDFGLVKLPKDLPARERLEAWIAEKGVPVDRNKYCIGGRYVMDDVVRHENLAADMERICGKLNLPWQPERLPRMKTGVRPAGTSAAEMFTAKARALVEQQFSLELDLFGYGFPAEAAAA